MEDEVEAAYRRAFPQADVYFVNADVMAEEYGGLPFRCGITADATRLLVTGGLPDPSPDLPAARAELETLHYISGRTRTT